MQERNQAPNRVRALREMRMMTQGRLAAEAQVSPQSISRIENGTMAPSTEMAQRIAAALGATSSSIMSCEHRLSSPVYFRSMSAATKGPRQAAARLTDEMDSLVSFLDRELDFPAFETNAAISCASPNLISDEDIEEAAADLRSEWGLGAGPVQDVVAAMESNGCIVSMVPLSCEKLDALSRKSSSGRPLVVIGTDKGNVFRWRLDAAHELGHMILHGSLTRGDEARSDMSKLIEGQAFRFAGAFLMPRDALYRELRGGTLDSFLSLKMRWGMSVQAMVRRASDIGLLTDQQYQNLYVGISKRKWRSVEPYDSDRLPERPTLLRTCLTTCVEQCGISAGQILGETGVPEDVLEDLAGFPRGWISSGRLVPRPTNVVPKQNNVLQFNPPRGNAGGPR